MLSFVKKLPEMKNWDWNHINCSRPFVFLLIPFFISRAIYSKRSWNRNKPLHGSLPGDHRAETLSLAAQWSYIYRDSTILPLPVPLPGSHLQTSSATTKLLLLPLHRANCLPSSCQALILISPNIIYIKPIYITQWVPDGEGTHMRLMCCFPSMIFSWSADRYYLSP